MNQQIETQKPFAGEVPFWVFKHLGKEVRLRFNFDEYGDGTFVYKRGRVAVLDAVQASADGNSHVVVTFLDDSTESLVDLPVNFIERIEEETVSPGDSFLARLPGRMREIVLTWRHGFDMKTQLSHNTFYRYRKLLLPLGIDIGRKPE